MLRLHVISAVFKRNVASYFSGVLGYLVIVVFVVAGAFVAFSPQFFTNNVASLDQLTTMFPILLLFLVPAITMSSWADERKLGTDELLFTLPASDVEILLGKYLAVLAVYSIALLFSLTHAIVLEWIGRPDWWVILSTYLGYFLAGAALLSAGMLASVLTNNTTVAFVLGTVICSVPVFIGFLASWNDFFQALSLPEQLRDFGLGIIPSTGVLYFVSLTVFMLYLNTVFISRRHWGGRDKTNMGAQFLTRAVALGVALVSINVLAAPASYSTDLTSERLYSLAPTTNKLIDEVEAERPVTIQAFLSPEVPRDYVPVRKRLVGLLRQIDRMGGNRIDVNFVDVEPSSEESEQARLLGIEPAQVASERDGRRYVDNVFLGVVVTSSFDEVVVPFFGPGTPIEYELMRSVRTVSNTERLTVGVLTTDAQAMGPSNSWRIINELKQQYEVVEVSPDSEIDGDKYNALIAMLPSSLTQPQMQNFVNYVKAGHAVLIFDDPFTMWFNSGWGVSNAPRLPKPSPGGGMGGMMGQRPQAPPKADGGRATTLLDTLDIAWDNGQIVWDDYNPHLEFGDVPNEYLFISPGSGVKSAFNQSHDITSGLQEILSAYSGTIRPRTGSPTKFAPLLRTSLRSGLMNWEDYTQQAFDPFRMQPTIRLAPNPSHFLDDESHVLAAHITADKPDRKLNVVYVADLDVITDWFFIQRERAEADLKLDNVTFVLNAVDVLAGDTSYLDLRKRRAIHRTLEAVEDQTAEFKLQRSQEEKEAAEEAEEQLKKAQASFQTQREELEKDESLDPRTREQLLRNVKATEERRLEVTAANLERAKEQKIDEVKARTDRLIRATQNRIRYLAVLIPPIPAVILGLIVLSIRMANEQRSVNPKRLTKR